MFERFRLFKQETKVITFEELPDFLDQNLRQEKLDVEGRIGPLVQDMRLNFSYIKSIATHLQTKNSQNKYSDMLKDKFCDKMKEAVDKISMQAAEYDSMVRFLSEAQSALNIISGISVKEFKHLVAFKDDMGKIAETVRHIEVKMAAANKAVQSSSFVKSDEIKKDIYAIKGLHDKISEIDTDILRTQETVVGLNNTILHYREQLEKINTQMSGYGSERMKIREMEKTLENITSQINKEFMGMDRIMKKFVYFGELSKEETVILKDYINDFAETFLEKDNNNILISILNALHNYKDKNMIDLDEKKDEKIGELVRQFDFLLELRSHYKEIKQSLVTAEKSLEEKFEPLKHDLKESVALVTSKEKDILNLQNKISSKRAEKELIEKQILDRRTKISLNAANLLGNQLKIV